MSDEFPLYPSLTEDGAQEAQKVMDAFKVKAKDVMQELLDDVLGHIYCDVTPHIESDHWTNYRSYLMDGFRGYKKGAHEYEFRALRKAIYENHKEEIIKDLNQDLVEEIERLNKQIEFLNKRRF